MIRVEMVDGKRVYSHDGIIKPSVSTILDMVFGRKYKHIPYKILQRKAELGTAVHEFIAGDGKLKLSIIDYVSQYQSWLKKESPEITGHEQQFCNKDFCGTADILTADAVIDIKTTTKIYTSAFYQVGAYCILTGKQKGYVLQLTQKSYNYVEVDVEKYKKQFNCLLAIYKEVNGER